MAREKTNITSENKLNSNIIYNPIKNKTGAKPLQIKITYANQTHTT